MECNMEIIEEILMAGKNIEDKFDQLETAHVKLKEKVELIEKQLQKTLGPKIGQATFG